MNANANSKESPSNIQNKKADNDINFEKRNKSFNDVRGRIIGGAKGEQMSLKNLKRENKSSLDKAPRDERASTKNLLTKLISV